MLNKFLLKWSLCCALMAGASHAFAQLPKDLKWVTNDKSPEFSSAEAKKGGTLNVRVSTYPLTFRWFGPDANSVLYTPILFSQGHLVELHPNTAEPIPYIATHWYVEKGNQSIYFKLDPAAQWSDGKPVTTKDFLFAYDLMRSKHIVSPWHNNQFEENFKSVTAIDDHTLHVMMKKPQVNIFQSADFSPQPTHFYGGTIDPKFVSKYNWAKPPVAGAYVIDRAEKGKMVSFKRVQNWWGEKLKYFKNRFNIDNVNFWTIREENALIEWFKTGKLDVIGLTEARYWFNYAKADVFTKGFGQRLWFYNEVPRLSFGLWMNQKTGILQDLDVRIGIQHALNIDKANAKIFQGEMTRLNSETRGYGKYDNTKVKARPFDINKAIAAFEKAGWKELGPDGIRVKDGKRLSVTATYSVDSYEPVYTILKDDARKAGLEFNYKFVDFSAMIKSLDSKAYEMLMIGMQGWFYPDYWQTFSSESKTDNLTNSSDKELDTLCKAYNDASIEAEKIALAHKIQERVHSAAAFVPLLQPEFMRIGMTRGLKFPTPAGPKTMMGRPEYFLFDPRSGGGMWIDEEMMKETQVSRKSGKSFPPVTTVDKTYQKS